MDYSIDEKNVIHPVQSGQVLLNDITRTQVKQGQVAIWWLGQSGYAIKTKTILFYVDLYLSEHLTAKYATTLKPHVRMTHAPLRGTDLRDVCLVFSSHKHSDHLDPGTIPAVFVSNPQAKLVLPKALVDHAKSLGLDEGRLISTRGDETLNLNGLKIHVVPSAHPGFDYDEATGYPFIGFVFDIDGVKLYHSGDTVVYDGLTERLRAHHIDVVFLPINGTDERRTRLKVPPNMGIDDALELAKKISSPGHAPLIIPHHYDMFTFNTIDVALFINAAQQRNLPFRVLQCGEKFIFKQI